MKVISLVVFAVSVTLSAFTLAAADGRKHEHAPKHGGVVTEVNDVEYELVAKPDAIQLYLSDEGKPIDVKGRSAAITLDNGKEKSEVKLAPAGDKLEAKGKFAVSSGTKAVAVVTAASGAPMTVRFTIK